MQIWVTKRLSWFVVPDDDHFFRHFAENGLDVTLEGLKYRKLDPVWLAWLRANCDDVEDSITQRRVQERMGPFGESVKEFMPDIAKSKVSIPGSYRPPLQSAVYAAQQ